MHSLAAAMVDEQLALSQQTLYACWPGKSTLEAGSEVGWAEQGHNRSEEEGRLELWRERFQQLWHTPKSNLLSLPRAFLGLLPS